MSLLAVLLVPSACGNAQDVLLGRNAETPSGGASGGDSGLGGATSGGTGSGVAGAASGGASTIPECSAEEVSAQRLSLLQNALGFGKDARGGADGCEVTVSSQADSGPGTLREALEFEGPAWIRFSVNVVDLSSDIQVRSDKTIDGSGGDVIIRNYGLRLEGATTSNVIVHGVEFMGTADGTGSEGEEESDDAILIADGARDVWIDHCEFSNYKDGLIDVIRGATNVTVSYNRFFNHRRVMLVGNENGGVEDEGIRVTIHHNWYQMTESYHPRLRRGWVHSFNNYLQQWEGFGSGSSEGGQLASEANVYEAGPDLAATVTQVADDAEPGLLRSMNDVLLGGAEVMENEPTMVFTPSDYYDYEPEMAGTELIATIESEAGVH